MCEITLLGQHLQIVYLWKANPMVKQGEFTLI